MEQKKIIIEKARRLGSAAEQAKAWIERNSMRVSECGQSKDQVLLRLRRQARLFRRLEKTAANKMCVGVFGPSQAGKSYLLSSLASNVAKEVPCDFGREQHDFLKEINPGGDKESTGLVTRFTMTPIQNVPDGYPVYVRLLGETELVRIFANTYFCDCDHKEKINKDEIRSELNVLKKRVQAETAGHITLDVMEELKEYISASFGGMARAAALDEIYWAEAIDMAPCLTLEDRTRLFGLIWDNIPEFNDMFLSLAQDLAKLDNAEDAFCAMDALLPRDYSIIDVDTLGKEFDSDKNFIEMCARSGQKTKITRKNASAIVAELTLVMTEKPAPYFDYTDLLDFPGYKARLECTDIREYLHKGKEDSAVEQFFRRGKVAYLFQRYNIEHELTSLLLCIAETNNTPGLPAAVENWIIDTHGKTPQDRLQTKTALFYILTKADRLCEQKSGIGQNDNGWDNVIKGRFLDQFAGVHSQATKWVEEWTPGNPFQNLFMLRNINIRWTSMLNYDGWNEVGIRREEEDHKNNLHSSFINSELAKRHFKNTEEAFDELFKFNDGGIGYIKESLEPLCNPELKLKQISNALEQAKAILYATLIPFYHSGDAEEELRKKKALFAGFGRLFANQRFKEHFPELLNTFKISPEKLFYLHNEAERRFDEYKDRKDTLKEEENRQNDVFQDITADPLNLLDIFDDPVAVAASPAQEEDAPSLRNVDYGEEYFYAERIIDEWSSHAHSLAENEEILRYYMFPKPLFLGVLDEFDLALSRMGILTRLEKKFRIIAQPIDVPRESKIRKQASYAMGVLSDFASWLGKNPAEINQSERVVHYQGQEVTVFKDKPEVGEALRLPETFVPFDRQWFKDWLTTFWGLLVDNVSFAGNNKINLEENSRLGEIMKTINQEQASA